MAATPLFCEATPERELSRGSTAKVERSTSPPLELHLPSGVRYPLDRALRIGKAPSGNEIILSDGAVSRHHCVIEPGLGSAVLRDLRSTNGTILNGVPIEAAELRGPAWLRVGRTELRLLPSSKGSHPLVGDSPLMQELRQQIDTLASTDLPVVIFGETGTGKELVARALHDRGQRRRGPFVAVNCGALPKELIESELFGHERGAFTGASSKRRGLFQAADAGTLFLDEVGEMPLQLQPRLLRVLESGLVRPIGTEREVAVSVRIVAASHVDLRTQVRAQKFRQDLYYRLAGVVVLVPALRNHLEDVPQLTDHLLCTLAVGKKMCTLSEAARRALLEHSWPGNVRELRHVLGRAVALASPFIDAADLGLVAEAGGERSFFDTERDLLVTALHRYGGRRRAAAALGIPKSTLCDRVRKYSID